MPVAEQARVPRRKLMGHFQYCGIAGNSIAIARQLRLANL